MTGVLVSYMLVEALKAHDVAPELEDGEFIAAWNLTPLELVDLRKRSVSTGAIYFNTAYKISFD